MKPRKLPSGSWNVRVIVGQDPSGKPIYKSITEKKRKDAVYKASIVRMDKDDMTVSQMVMAYISQKDSVLSPNTYRGYMGIFRANIDGSIFGEQRISLLTNSIVQRWVSDLAKTSSPKTVKNCYSLFSASLKMFYPRLVFTVKLPQVMRRKLHTPSTSEINEILSSAKEYNYELYKAILIGAVGMMRQGEIAALTAEDCDFKRNTIHVYKAQAYTQAGQFIIKPPKNESSNRVIVMPEFVMKLLPKEGKLVDLNIMQISSYFRKLMAKTDLPHFRFHDLRHYAASIAASSSVGASVETIKARGGWASDSMMKRVYIDQIGDEVDKDTKAITNYFAQYLDKK